MKTVPDESNNDVVKQKLFSLLRMPFEVISNDQNEENLIPFLQQQFQINYSLQELEMELHLPGIIRELERNILLEQIDFSWKEHLQKIALLRDVVGWRAYGQKDPLTEYKQEAFNFFVVMLTRMRHRVTYSILQIQIVSGL